MDPRVVGLSAHSRCPHSLRPGVADAMIVSMLALLGDGAPVRAETRPHPRGPRRLPEAMAEEGWAAGFTASGRHGHPEPSESVGLPSELVGITVLVVDD